MEELKSDFRLENSKVKSVIDSLKENPDCKKLSLSNNNIDSTQAALLFEYLRDNQNDVEVIDMAMNHIGQVRLGEAKNPDQRAAGALAEYVGASNKLKVLKINSNHLGRDSLRILGAALAKNDSLEEIYLGSNPVLGDLVSPRAIFESIREGVIQNTSLTKAVIARSAQNQYAIDINKIVECDYQAIITEKFCLQRDDRENVVDLDEEEAVFLSKKKNVLNVLFAFVLQSIKDEIAFEGSMSLLEDMSVGSFKEAYCPKIIDVINLEQGPFMNFDQRLLEQFKQDLHSIAPVESPQQVQNNSSVLSASNTGIQH